jgi:hypothetical protein
MVIPTMPEEMRATLLSQLRLVYPGLAEVDSVLDGARFAFPSIHFSYYNRYSNRVSPVLD